MRHELRKDTAITVKGFAKGISWSTRGFAVRISDFFKGEGGKVIS